jgi:peptidoglycan/xylan/chitin deacetylase (PgdA/CDA1 family)/glycosyltransferase involved in cell wall biosynthesis
MIELSIVIPTYNRAKRLWNCLEALTKQTQSPGTFEVIVVIDGSTDETVEMLKSFVAPYLLRTIWQGNNGQPSALNRGIREADGRYCLFIDDDIVATSQLVAEHLQAQRQYPHVVAIGQITLAIPSDAGWYANAFSQGWRDHYDLLNQEDYKPTWEDCYSGNMSVPREALLTCGGFNMELARGFDLELAKRLEKKGCSFVYVPNALGCQYERKGFWELSQDAEKSGKADVVLYQQDPQMLSQALASFPQESWRKLLLHRLLLKLPLSPGFLELLGRLIQNPARRYSWFSVIQKYCYWRGVRQVTGTTILWQQLTSGIPILMYHAIGLPHESAGPFVMTANRFAKQMAWLKRMGYHPISLTQFLTCQREKQLPPARSVVITFDDGYADNYTYAFPILRQYGIPATIFLVSKFIGHINIWDQDGQLGSRPLMSWSQIQEMKGQGIHFGAHSSTHPALTAISSFQAVSEITDSRKLLESKLGVPANIFAYPYGEYNLSIQSILQEAGFIASCTIDTGLNTLITPSFLLRRAEVQGVDSFIRFWLVLWMGDGEAFWWRRSKNYSRRMERTQSSDK